MVFNQGSNRICCDDSGADKAIDTSMLVEAIVAHCKQVILIPGSGTDRLVESLNSVGFDSIIVIERVLYTHQEYILKIDIYSGGVFIQMLYIRQ